MINPSQFTWTDPTTNTDGSPIVVGEITGYTIGVRLASGAAGTYPILTDVVGAAAAKEAIAQLSQALVAGDYAAAIQTSGPTVSAWSAETTFTIAPEVPNPPTGFSAS